MIYFVGCIVAYVVMLVVAKRLEVLPVMRTYRRDEVDVEDTVFRVIMLTLAAAFWPIASPILGAAIYACKPNKEKEKSK